MKIKNLPAVYYNRAFHLEEDLDLPYMAKVLLGVAQPRNIDFHRLFFLLISTTFKGLHEKYDKIYPNAESLRKSVLIISGQVELIWNGKEFIPIPLSLAFDNMDNIQFKEVFNRCADTCLALAPGIEKEILRLIT